MKSTERFIALLEERDLVSTRTADSLREQISGSKKPIPPEKIAKRLIKAGRLTSTQAKRLLAALEEESGKAEPKAKAPADDDIGFAPLDEDKEKAKRESRSRGEKPTAKPTTKPTAKPAAKPETKRPAKPAAATPKQPSPGESLFDQEMPGAAPAAQQSGGGPLDGLMADAAMSASTGGPLDAKSSKGGGLFGMFRKGKPKVKTEEEKWGSSLMLLGGGGLLLIVILGVVLVWAISRTDGDEMLRLANEDYRGGSYHNAINAYQKYLEKFPNHPSASLARVRIGLAQLRQATAGSNWPEALQTAETVLKDIAPEESFKEAHGELASMLPDIAKGLAALADKKTSQELVDKARTALKMAGNPMYVPKNLRPNDQLAETEALLAITVRNITRDQERDKTIAEMRAAAKESRTQQAYAACSALLKQHPGLADDADLKKAVLEVSSAQRALVKFVEAPKPPEQTQAATDNKNILGTITLSQNDMAKRAPGADGMIALAAVDGTVFGLNASDGKPLWRKRVGFATNPRAPAYPPTLLSAEPGSDALVVDAENNSLLRLAAASGDTVWQQSIGARLDAFPVIVGKKILVATKQGKLYTILSASGQSPGYIQFPQELTVAPAVDARRKLIFQVADHSNIYVLSSDDGSCKDVFYLGHSVGSVNTAPVIVGDFLLLAENSGANDCMLKLFAVRKDNSDAKDEPWLKLVQQISLGGHVKSAPLVDRRRVLVATAAGVIKVYEISATDVKKPLREIADTAIDDAGDNVVRYLLLRSGRVWIGATQLKKYDVQAAAGRISSQWIADQEGTFLQPPVVVGDSIVCVQRRPGMPGAVVSSVSMIDPDQYWTTQVGSPPAAAPLVSPDGKQATAVTAAGAIFRFDLGRGGRSIASTPLAAPDATRIRHPINSAIQLANGLVAISGGKDTKQLGVFDPNASTPLMYWIKLHDDLACDPIAFGGGILAADLAGRISLVDPQSGDTLVEPFQPRLEPGEKIHWIRPAVAGEKEIVVANGQGKIYRLGIQDKPKPHLEMLAQTVLDYPIVSPLAVAGKLMFGVDKNNVLNSFNLTKLDRAGETNVDSHCAWGPARVGENILLTTDDNRLFCLAADGATLWQTKLECGPLAGAPLPIEGGYILVGCDGTLLRIAAEDGKELGKLQTGIPFATGATMMKQGLLVGGFDGTIYEMRQP